MFPILWCIVQLHFVRVFGSTDWSYTNSNTDVHHWQSGFPSCNGSYQSPINIAEKEAVYSKYLAPVSIVQNSQIDLNKISYTVKNNGHSVTVIFPVGVWYIILNLDHEKRYEVVQLHFHWGSKKEIGGEHTLNGKSFSMETHIVAFNRIMYSDFIAAKGSPNGLAVLGILSNLKDDVEESKTVIGSMGNLENVLPQLMGPETEVNISAFALDQVLTTINPKDFYRYMGSLTTPGCTENVAWTVFAKPAAISGTQLKLLRSLKFPKSETQSQMMDNFRPTMPLNSDKVTVPRTVYCSWNHSWRLSLNVLLLLLMVAFRSAVF